MFCVFAHIKKHLRYFPFPVPAVKPSLLRFKCSFKWCMCIIWLPKPHINTVTACLCRKQLALELFGGTGDRSRACNRSVGKGDLRWSRRPQPIQEVNTVLRSASHEAPTRLTLWNPCEWLVWSVCVCVFVWMFLRDPIKCNHNTRNNGS